jgi:hypothetical protein
MSLTLEEAKHLIQTIATTREQWYTEAPNTFLGKVYRIEDRESFKEVMNTKGKQVETLKNENTDLFSLYQQEDKLCEALQRFKYHQKGVDNDPTVVFIIMIDGSSDSRRAR